MSAHTPGPWSCEPTPESSHWDWKVTQPRINGRRPYIGIDTDNAEADSRLIAAAPDLLAALLLLQAEVVASGNADADDFGWPRALSAAHAAIAKATGKST
jgi:hypothetical protein